jgi:hypothetical protein
MMVTISICMPMTLMAQFYTPEPGADPQIVYVMHIGLMACTGCYAMIALTTYSSTLRAIA